MKKKFLVGAAVGTTGLIALTGATFAQTGGENPATSVRERVAEILGIAPEDLQDAFEQARDEHRDQKIADRLANAVEEGVITQDEADVIIAWLDAMPEVLEGVAGHGHRNGVGPFVMAQASEEKIAFLVERLLNAGKITETDVDAVTAWLGDAPTDALAKLGKPDNGRPNHRRGFRGRMYGEGPGGRLFEGRFHIRPYTPPTESGEPGESGETGVATTFAVDDAA